MSTLTATPAAPERTQPAPRRRARRLLVRALAAVAVLALVGLTAQALLEARDARAFPPPGDLVDVGGGRQLHLHVTGEEHEGPAVVLEAAVTGFSPTWAWVQRALSEHATVVSYDRAGLGWSDPADAPVDAEFHVRDLRRALRARGIDGPYVLVGHSFGGMLIRAFAAEHPDDVAGLVFVDSSHEDLFADEGPGELAAMRAMLAVLQPATRLGILRLHNPVAGEIVDSLPDDVRDGAVARQVRGDHATAARKEAAAMPRVADRLRGNGSGLGDLPVRVLTAGDNEVLRPFHPGLAGLSTEGRHEIVAGADHIGIVVEERHAAEVSEAVTDILEGIDH